MDVYSLMEHSLVSTPLEFRDGSLVRFYVLYALLFHSQRGSAIWWMLSQRLLLVQNISAFLNIPAVLSMSLHRSNIPREESKACE